MNDPHRLLESSPNGLLRSLLGSGLNDTPHADALPKVTAALGLTTAAVSTSSLAAAGAATQAVAAHAAGSNAGASTTVAGHAAASAGALGVSGGNTVVALGKTLLVSMVSAGTLSVAAVAVHEYARAPGASATQVEPTGAEPSASDRQLTHARAQRALYADKPAVAEPVGTVSEASATTNVRVPSKRRERQSPHTDVRAQSVSDSLSVNAAAQPAGVLAREVRQIDAARLALASRNADGALAVLDDYNRSRIVGVLDREALLLEIEAFMQKQNVDRARQLARQYVVRFPMDAHAQRLRALSSKDSSSAQASFGE